MPPNGFLLRRAQTIHIGLHHSKMILLKYRTGVRVVIMTCNMRMDCWAGRCQAAWYQDFPLKTATGACSSKRKRKGNGKDKGKKKALAAASVWGCVVEQDDEDEEDEGEEDEDEVIVTSEFEVRAYVRFLSTRREKLWISSCI